MSLKGILLDTIKNGKTNINYKRITLSKSYDIKLFEESR